VKPNFMSNSPSGWSLSSAITWSGQRRSPKC
jgi:hypothetical protein